MKDSYQRILAVVKLIPFAHVASYGQVADLAGLPNRARLVSKALKVATDNSDIPWHRVVNSQGYVSIPKSEPAYQQQLNLLRDEGVELKGTKVNFIKHRWQPSIETLLFELSY
ncbi:MGMT family protein [Psychrobium sp. 1_MG-2023]|uniref:MGMT family protein n=1 Tax=Psychrobium sp. 1_MG-2023 TaxID=3062624 RepID=UPI000C33F703|nr:MGMT family protein [Psychrobium sp. 1_MG-2023]MDP2561161.1 MGMT family protein [Psychrobium sp. 1_MG-2023]PKF55135.1 cysteine methyltransferase [Alteromonadales bacterium alter-6D02]